MIISASSYSQTIEIATGDGPPYIIVSQDGTLPNVLPGFSIEIVRAAFSNMAHKTTFVIQPFSRQIADTRSGKIDAMMAVFKSDAPDLIFARQPIGIAQNCFFVKAGTNWQYVSLLDLEKITLGVANGYTYGEIDKYISSNKSKILVVSGDDGNVVDSLLRLTKLGRIQAFIEAEAVVNYHLERKAIDGIHRAGCTVLTEAFLAFSSNLPYSQTLANEFDRQVNALRQSGHLAKILGKYNVADWR